MHHKDPFDRMIVAQAMVEQIPIVSVDVAVRRLRHHPDLVGPRMSDLNQINDGPGPPLPRGGARIVFWNDPEREFLNVLPFLLLDGVTTLRLDQEAALEVKIRLERDDPTGKFLLYSPDRGARLRGRLAARHPPLQPQLPGGPGLDPARPTRA